MGDCIEHPLSKVISLLGEEPCRKGENIPQGLNVRVGGEGYKEVCIGYPVNLCNIQQKRGVQHGALLCLQ